MNRLSLAVLCSFLAIATTGCEPPVEACGPSTCTGCCNAAGACVGGAAQNACGLGGAVCTDCSLIGACSSGVCQTATGGGAGGGTGGGAGGGVAGGGTGGGMTGGGTGGGVTGGGTGGGVTGGGTGGGVTGGGTGGGVTGGGTGGGVTGGGTGGGGVAPVGDACTAPVDIVLANGVGAAVGDRTNSTDDSTGTCGGQGGGDIVFRFTTTSVGTLTVDVRPNDSNQQLSAYLRTTCDQGATEVPGACVQAQSAGGGAMLLQRNLPAGTYFLWVDGAGSATGQVSVSLNFTTDLGDTCATPAPLPFTNGEANVAGSTAGAINDGTATCGGSGADVIYRFDVTTLSNFDVTVSPRNVNVTPVVYLRGSTCGGAQLGCSAATAPGASALLRLSSLAPGTYYLWVDGATANSGDYALTAHLAPPVPGETCTNARALNFSNGPMGGTASDVNDTTPTFNDGAGSCAAGTSGDLVYTFTTSTTLDLRVTASTTSGTFRPAVYLRFGTCAGAERACNAAALAGGSATLVQGSLVPGTYFLWVDGAANTNGPFALSATLTPPLLGDTCNNPETLAFSNGQDGGTAMDTGDTSLLFHEWAGSCNSGTGGDAVYTFTTNAPLDLRATASTTSSTFEPALYLRNTSCAGTERTCNAATMAGGSASLAVGSLPAGTYFMLVDGQSSTSGPYSLSASLTPPLPGEGCANPKTLAFSNGPAGGTAADTGTTAVLFHETVGSCAAGTSSDAVYTFTTNTPLDFRVTASTTTSTFQPVLYLRNTSCTGTERACSVATVAGGTAQIATGALPAGTYFLFIDGAAGTSGNFSLSASLTTPVLGESCTNPKPLVFTSGNASDTGNTMLNFDDSLTTCGSTGAPDVVYSFTTTSTLDFTATATTTNGTYRPSLALRNATCTGTERTCNAATIAGGQAALGVQGLPPGTYFLWVEGAGSTAGPYSLTATLGPAPADAVRGLPVVNVTAPGPMSVTYEVIDRFGNVITTDNTTSFTVNVTGAALFTGAATGTIVSGTGTNSAIVRVTGGRVTLTLSDAMPETVIFTTVDSQPNGLRYPGTTFTQTAPDQTCPCMSGVQNFNFATLSVPTGPGTVTIVARGDLNGGTSEYLDLFMESVTGTALGSAFTNGPGQCATTDGTATLSVPLAALQAAVADGTATVAVRGSSSISCTLCTATSNFARVTLSFPSTITGTFTP